MAASFVSLKGEIMPLRELLLEWRKREVLSWNNLLNDVELEQLQSASTYGLELIDAVKSAICEVMKNHCPQFSSRLNNYCFTGRQNR